MAEHAKRRIVMQVRATPEAGEGAFSAKVSTYDLEYDIGWGWTEKILAGCFTDSIGAHPTIPIFYNHDWDGAPIGAGKPTESDTELVVDGRLYLEIDDPLVARVYQAMKDGALEEWSIGFWPETITNSTDLPHCDQIAEGDLAEASVCVRGANPDTGTIDLAHRRAYIAGDPRERRQEVARIRRMFGDLPDLGRRSDGDGGGTESRFCDRCGSQMDDDDSRARAGGHTHAHSHDGGATSHSHAHTHSGGNYGHDSTDPEIPHEHTHPADDSDPDADEDTRARMQRALDSPHWRAYAADIIREGVPS